MGIDEKEHLVVQPYASQEPLIGRYLWALQDARRRTLRQLDDLTPAMIDWQPAKEDSSIGAVLYHLAVIEADWLYAEVLTRPLPTTLSTLFSAGVRDKDGRLVLVPGVSLADHLQRLAAVREQLLDVFMQMELVDFRRPRVLPEYDVTPEWVLHHLMQHEAEHRSQLGALRASAAEALGMG